jgi:hypothetical protein
LHIRTVHLWQYAEMARKKKAKKFSAVQAVKAAAREKIGVVRPLRVIPATKKTKSDKHKVPLSKRLEEE